uniref:Zona pellucida sperm-binding protein 3 n=1 Tax=Denticeps clupeoides TaxID=299321 RepID=A0AAY4AZT8_9TELE
MRINPKTCRIILLQDWFCRPQSSLCTTGTSYLMSARLGRSRRSLMLIMCPIKVELQDPGSVQQQLLGPVKELTWKFPQMPVEPTSPPVQFQLREPVSVSSVAATCDENMVHVQVKKDLFGSGELIQASDISLGGCGVTGEDSVAQLLYFQSYLQACGSQVVMTNDSLVYSFSLTYIPRAISDTSAPIVRTSGAVIRIECHYLRLHNVSSNALQPAWIPYAATKTAEELLVFSLKLMTDDWKFERPSNVYYMGDLIHFEASVKQYNHVPLRVFVDTCVVTAVPDAAAAPSYLFIQNHGCLVDSKLTGSSSRYLPRTQDFKLQFQLEAFRFQQGDTGSLFITCLLKATAAASPTDAEHKACSFVGWCRWRGPTVSCLPVLSSGHLLAVSGALTPWSQSAFSVSRHPVAC